ncbi:MAG: N-acetylgalactosamine 6-sulfate sulfatase (GALNS), partial [Verrucomicrobia bacterium]|nr:N-acetylgalactosamine 6-sulfate sulfatase (GALNS) [Verrucomicrobiota bacterium]
MQPSFSIFLLILIFITHQSSAKKQTNIIYLMLDEWGYFESGHMGSTHLITPNIDQFASEGMRFTNAYAG